MPRLFDYAEREMARVQQAQRALRAMLNLPEMEVEGASITTDGIIGITANGNFSAIVSTLESAGWEKKFENHRSTRLEKDAVSIVVLV